MGIDQFTENGLKVGRSELVYFLVQPENLSVLSQEGIRGKVMALTNLLRGTESVRLLALDSRESFQSNKNWYRQRMEQEELPALRELLRQDAAHLDSIQTVATVVRHGLRAGPPEGRTLPQSDRAAGAEHPGPGLPGPAGQPAGPHASAGGLLPAGRDHGYF